MEIKKITPLTNIEELTIYQTNKDLIIENIPYNLVAISEYYHNLHLDGYGPNNLWAYPRGTEPVYGNLIPFNSAEPVLWGIHSTGYLTVEYDLEYRSIKTERVIVITRNGDNFCNIPYESPLSLTQALLMVKDFKRLWIDVEAINFENSFIGAKVWFNDQPAVIESYISGEARVIIAPDNGLERFAVPAYMNSEIAHEFEQSVNIIIDILDPSLQWNRS